MSNVPYQYRDTDLLSFNYTAALLCTKCALLRIIYYAFKRKQMLD